MNFHPNPNNHKSNKGVALLTVVVLLFAVMILILTGAQLITNSYRESKQQQNTVAEAENVAKSGLVDAISWFKRQEAQPVHNSSHSPLHSWEDGAFNPKEVKLDTIDENMGLVKEYELSENGIRWARYEVKRQSETIVPDAAQDITAERFNGTEQKGDGLAWSIVSTGYVYRRKAAIPFNIFPNEIVAKCKMSTEIIRMNLQIPACAFIVKDGGTAGHETVNLFPNGRINGGSSGTACGRFLGQPPLLSGGTVIGSSLYSVVLNDPTIKYVLGISTIELKSLADFTVGSVNSLPNPLPDMSLIYIDGDATFDLSRPLKASGVLVVNGNLTVSAGSSSLFSGLIYVSGTITINPPCDITGCVIAYSGLTLNNLSTSDITEIDYDNNILTAVRQRICQYRENKSAHRTLSIPNF
ncbi:MAG: hypothetical protein PHE88_04955 [Elusimicrobia bacterium]|nr:hypothetical protein [Elusimicrobiota bacterium]